MSASRHAEPISTAFSAVLLDSPSCSVTYVMMKSAKT
jgi:hypothetical protein